MSKKKKPKTGWQPGQDPYSQGFPKERVSEISRTFDAQKQAVAQTSAQQTNLPQVNVQQPTPSVRNISQPSVQGGATCDLKSQVRPISTIQVGQRPDSRQIGQTLEKLHSLNANQVAPAVSRAPQAQNLNTPQVSVNQPQVQGQTIAQPQVPQIATQQRGIAQPQQAQQPQQPQQVQQPTQIPHPQQLQPVQLGQTAQQVHQPQQPQQAQQPQQPQQAQKVQQPAQPKPQTTSVKKKKVTYDKGCCGAAWQDILNSKGWIGKTLLFALINYVPVLRWVISGYSMRWSRQLFFGKVQSLPKGIFADRSFVTGAKYFLVSMVVAIVTGMVCFVFGFIPFMSFTIIFVFTVFVQMVMNFCYVRMAIFDDLGEGFKVNKSFMCVTRDFGKAFCVEFFPSLIFDLAAFLITLTITMFFFIIDGFSIFTSINAITSQFYTYEAFLFALENIPAVQVQVNELIMAYLPILFILIVICKFFTNICSVLKKLIQMRAAGHFVTRYCDDWKSEPKFKEVLTKEQEGDSQKAVA